MLQNKFADLFKNILNTVDFKCSPPSSFLTLTTFCLSGVFLQITIHQTDPDDISRVCPPTHTKEM